MSEKIEINPQARLKKVLDENEMFSQANAKLLVENASLKIENNKLKEEVAHLELSLRERPQRVYKPLR